MFISLSWRRVDRGAVMRTAACWCAAALGVLAIAGCTGDNPEFTDDAAGPVPLDLGSLSVDQSAISDMSAGQGDLAGTPDDLSVGPDDLSATPDDLVSPVVDLAESPDATDGAAEDLAGRDL